MSRMQQTEGVLFLKAAVGIPKMFLSAEKKIATEQHQKTNPLIHHTDAKSLHQKVETQLHWLRDPLFQERRPIERNLVRLGFSQPDWSGAAAAACDAT